MVTVGIILFKPKKEIATSTVQIGNIKEELTLSGELDSSESVSLAFQGGGRLSWIGVEEGDYVYKGQSLASLDTRIEDISINKALNVYSITRNDFEQANYDNRDWRVISDVEERNRVDRILQKYQLTLNNSVLDVELQSVTREYSGLVSPINGIVTGVTSPIAGINIPPGQTQITIVNPNTLYVSVTADQIDIPFIKMGDTAEIIFDAYTDDTVKGEVNYISFVPKVGETGTAYEIKIALKGVNNRDLKYKIGMTVDVNFVLAEKKDVLFVEPQFIKTDKKGKYIVVDNGKRRIEVETGIEGDSKVEIRGDFKQGDKVYSVSLSK